MSDEEIGVAIFIALIAAAASSFQTDVFTAGGRLRRRINAHLEIANKLSSVDHYAEKRRLMRFIQYESELLLISLRLRSQAYERLHQGLYQASVWFLTVAIGVSLLLEEDTLLLGPLSGRQIQWLLDTAYQIGLLTFTLWLVSSIVSALDRLRLRADVRLKYVKENKDFP